MADEFKAYNFFVPHERVHPLIEGPSMTRQEFVKESDINVLMARFEKHGVLPQIEGKPQYLDLSDVPDFQAAMNLMIEAERAFMTLPAAARREFDNDPGKFVAFAEQRENLPKMREWGLAPPEAAPDAVPPARPGAEPAQADKSTQ